MVEILFLFVSLLWQQLGGGWGWQQQQQQQQ